MPQRHSRLVTVLLAAALLAGAANLGAYAATGGPLLLGKSNSSDKTTKLKTTGKGPALKLKSKPGKAPFTVSNDTRIKKLNADLLDGLDGSALQTKAYRYNLTGTSTGTTMRFALPGLPAGQYVVNYAVNAQLSGAASFFGCVLDSGAAFESGQVAALGATAGGDAWYVNGGGPLDTRARAYTLTCQSSGGVTFTIPTPFAQAQIVLTRVDETVTTASTGVHVPTMKPGLAR
ncbi:hypothetical protein [Nocardioides sp.]|uniref:hypothetical protein n=1 Tax=Nocardioides sp. TaxID=35761 RepID=UPI001A337111|nr:hypothetical protein [Nocardioides sp.]MBJ7358886.1 hypothetical protein [Nocardioides sp.]